MAAAVFAAAAVTFAVPASLILSAFGDTAGAFDVSEFLGAFGVALLFTVPGATVSGFLNADWLRDETVSDPSWVGEARRGLHVVLMAFVVNVVILAAGAAVFESSLLVALHVLMLSLTFGLGFLLLSLPFGVVGSVVVSRFYQSQVAQAA